LHGNDNLDETTKESFQRAKVLRFFDKIDLGKSKKGGIVMFKLNVKKVLQFLVLVCLMVWPCSELALSADYPTKPIEFIIPFASGGRTDIAGRMIAPFLEKQLGVPVVVINKVGGGGVIGMNYVKDAKPDGYTICSGGQAMVLFHYEKPGAPSFLDYTWIARTYLTPLVLVVNTSSPFKTLNELMEYAKAHPGKLKHGNTGSGNTTHIASEKFAKKFGIKFTQVPYQGEGPAVKGIGTGEVDMVFGLMAAFRPLVEAGELRVLGVADEKRNPLYPEISTFREQGIDHVEPFWECIHTPKGLPKNVYDKLFEACKKALTNPELIEKAAKIGLNINYQPGPEFFEMLKSWDKGAKEMIFELGLQLKK
jgi:tripartite-type tricarboxylate transporter receptor subunit TctC